MGLNCNFQRRGGGGGGGGGDSNPKHLPSGEGEGVMEQHILIFPRYNVLFVDKFKTLLTICSFEDFDSVVFTHPLRFILHICKQTKRYSIAIQKISCNKFSKLTLIFTFFLLFNVSVSVITGHNTLSCSKISI